MGQAAALLREPVFCGQRQPQAGLCSCGEAGEERFFQVQDAAPAVISTGSVLHGLIRGQLMLLFLQRLGLCLNFCLWEPMPQVQVLDQAMDLYYR